MIKIVWQQSDRLEQVLIRFSNTRPSGQCLDVKIAHLLHMAFIRMSVTIQIKMLWLAHPASGQINVLSFGCISISNYESHASRLDHCAMGRGVAWHQ